MHNDFGVAYRFLDPCVLSTDVTPDGPPAALLLYRGSEKSPGVSTENMTMLRLLMPAFKAGVHTAIRMAHARRRLAVLIDDLADGLAVYDAEGRVLHRNPSLTSLLAEDPEASGISAEIDRLALATLAVEERRTRQRRYLVDALPGPGAPTSRRVRTGASIYELRGSLAPPDLIAHRGAVLVLVERASPKPLSDPEARARYGLIAEALGISHHTVRRHTERILRKLGVHTRGAVSKRLVHEESAP